MKALSWAEAMAFSPSVKENTYPANTKSDEPVNEWLNKTMMHHGKIENLSCIMPSLVCQIFLHENIQESKIEMALICDVVFENIRI